jgi:integrase
MESVPLDVAGHRRSPATMPRYHRGRPPRNKGEHYPADPPTVDEIIAVMRAVSDRADGQRLRALIVLLWRAGLRIGEAPDLNESDLGSARGAVLVRRVSLALRVRTLLPRSCSRCVRNRSAIADLNAAGLHPAAKMRQQLQLELHRAGRIALLDKPHPKALRERQRRTADPHTIRSRHGHEIASLRGLTESQPSTSPTEICCARPQRTRRPATRRYRKTERP